MVHLPVNEKPKPATGGGCSSGGCDPNAKCGNGLEKIYPTCAVRYGYMRYIGEFRYAPGMLFGCGAKVVIQTNRGIEIGEQVSLTCSGCEKSVSRAQMMKYVKASGPEHLRLKAGRILREATAQDLDEETHLNQQASRELARAREVAVEMKLAMKVITCEHLFGGERLILHFLSEDRIDFRELVRVLAHEFHTRIEMHQVGARDEARLVADYEVCGRECCCKNFLKKLRPVSMRMAKLQKATLDPSKVSGRCGRLRCCLRYEHEGYEELDKKLPRNSSFVRTEQGIAIVVDRQILTQLLMVQYEGGKIETVPIEEILERNLPRPAPTQPPPGGPPPGRGDRGGPRGEADRRPGGDRPGRGPNRPRPEIRDDRPRDDRPRDDRPRDDQPREDRPRDDRPPRQEPEPAPSAAEENLDESPPAGWNISDKAEPTGDEQISEPDDFFNEGLDAETPASDGPAGDAPSEGQPPPAGDRDNQPRRHRRNRRRRGPRGPGDGPQMGPGGPPLSP